ncbi:amidohydrolase family protein [Nitrospirillum sp. BR 11163]|uniref:amidohydrolase family protein n=1 Tax=Nitrospirillum sp. BR 11163 TaxID=3104323 RepID=UPI002AFFEB8F|nr:amidohydrolase family protein [Nitrospirillum sp. BR 11163]MEA1674648.1 amidohydrolase family protein [Nitrospirillum sp. BR 11163]
MTSQPIYDLHAHWFSGSTIDFLRGRSAVPRIEQVGDTLRIRHSDRDGGGLALGPQWFDVEARLKHLDDNGIAHQLISWPTTLGVDAALSAQESLPLWEIWNDDVAALVSRHPGRFSGLAALSTSDIAWSVRELERAHTKLGLIGGTLPVNGFFSKETARSFLPIFEAAQHFKSHIYLHTGFAHPSVPHQPPANTGALGNRLNWLLDSAWHFASGVTTLAFSDFLAPFPDVTVQVAMLGGSGLAATVAEQAEAAGLVPDVRENFRQIWLDTGAAGSGSAAIAAAVRVLGADRIVFGTDFGPVPDTAPVIGRVRAAARDEAEAAAIFAGNAQALLSRHVRPL